MTGHSQAALDTLVTHTARTTRGGAPAATRDDELVSHARGVRPNARDATGAAAVSAWLSLSVPGTTVHPLRGPGSTVIAERPLAACGSAAPR